MGFPSSSASANNLPNTPSFLISNILISRFPWLDCLLIFNISVTLWSELIELFIYESTKYFYGSNGFLRLSNYRLTLITGAGLIFLAIIFYEKIYTRTYFSLAGILLILIYLYKPNWWGNFLTMFLFALIPFFIINGFLTGSFTEHPIVIYNDEQNLGIRILNIPLEDVFYCFNILVLVVALYEYQLSKVLSVK